MMISKRIGASALVLMACLCFTAQCSELLTTFTSYRKKLLFLSSMMKQESVWKHVFEQSVIYEFDKHFYRETIENYILKGAIDTEVTQRITPIDESEGAEKILVREIPKSHYSVKPKIILRNLFTNWFRMGTLLSTAFQIVQLSVKCLAYKHGSILLTLIQTEMSRNIDQHRAAHWSEKLKVVLADILMKMAALQLSDGVYLRMAKFFNIYDKGLSDSYDNKFSFVKTLDNFITVMMKFIANYCHRFVHTHSDVKISGMPEIAKELEVVLVPELFNPSESKYIEDKLYKEMFNSSLDKIKEHFADLPYTIAMTKFHWNSFLSFDRNLGNYGDDDAYYTKIKS